MEKKFKLICTPSTILISYRDFEELTAKQIIEVTMKDLSCNSFGGAIPRRAETLKQAIKLYKSKNWLIE